MYDFVLFENTSAVNHQKDVELIAKLMQAGGLNVAIAEVYNEREYCKDTTIPHIRFKRVFEDRFLLVEDEPNTALRIMKNQLILHRYEKYLEYVVTELKGKTRNIYAGSHSNVYSFSWIRKVAPNIKIYFWGLRSYRLYEHKIAPFSLGGYNSFFNRKYFYKFSNVCFFVSDEMIRQEFINCGISSERLVIRRERTTKELHAPKTDGQDGAFKLLSIGTIRPEKQIEIVINALRKMDSSAIVYTIAGKTDERSGYEKVIEQASAGMPNVVRKNYRLSEEEFSQLMDDCDFLILCDKKQATNVTNGTMNEALLNGRPIIAPDYDPYRYVINKYDVGLLFNPTDESSLVNVIKKAAQSKASAYLEQLISYQKSLLFENVAKEFCSNL